MRTLKFAAVAAAAGVAAASGAQSAVFEELLRMDCKGVGHALPNSPFESHFDFGIFRAGLEVVQDRITQRVNEYCDMEATAEQINRKFIPTMDSLMSWVFGDFTSGDDNDCFKEAFVTNLFEMGGLMNIFTALDECPAKWDYYRSILLLNVGGLFPETCTLDTWRNDGVCRFKVTFQDTFGAMDIEAAVERCSGDSAWPFMSLTCGGEACSKYFKPCTADSQCGDNLGCSDLGLLIPAVSGKSTENLVSTTIADAFTAAGLWHSSMPSSLVTELIIKPARQFWGGYFTSPSIGSSFNDYLKFCLPKKYNGSSYPSIKGLVDAMFPQIEHACTPTGPYDWWCSTPGWQQCGCNNAGKYYTQDMEVGRIFQLTSGTTFHCNFTGSGPIFSADCPSDNSQCYQTEKVITGDAAYPPMACHTASSGACNFAYIGDGFCDSACNIAECKFDGRDCDSSYGAATETKTRSTCPADVLDVEHSPCVDTQGPYGWNSCIQSMRDYERGWFSPEWGCSEGSYNQDYCCVCNATTLYTTPEVNSQISFSRGVMTCNHLHAWDGILASGDSVSTLHDVTTSWPSYESFNPATGEVQLLSFDCEGYFAASLMVPFGRAYVPGPLAAFRKLEQIMISLVAKRQELQGGPALVTESGTRLNRLGLMHYGVHTPLHLLLQLSTALRTHTQSEDFKYYNNTTPISKMLRRREGLYNGTYVYEKSWGVEFPTSCNFDTYSNTRLCLVKYTSPLFEFLDWKLTMSGGMKECAASHLPEFVLSAKGDFFSPKFPFASPCADDNDCPATTHECANLLQRVNDVEFTESGKTLVDLEYDLLTFLLFGRSGRTPGYPARDLAWINEDIAYTLNKIYGEFAEETLGANLPPMADGSFNLCFNKKDPLLLKLVKTGNIENFGQVVHDNDIQFVEVTPTSHSGYTTKMDVIRVINLDSVSEIPIGMDTTKFSTKAPTNPGETPAPTSETESGAVSGKFVATLMSMAVVLSSSLLLLL